MKSVFSLSLIHICCTRQYLVYICILTLWHHTYVPWAWCFSQPCHAHVCCHMLLYAILYKIYWWLHMDKKHFAQFLWMLPGMLCTLLANRRSFYFDIIHVSNWYHSALFGVRIYRFYNLSYITPVSYTHLDVYKRQLKWNLVFIFLKEPYIRLYYNHEFFLISKLFTKIRSWFIFCWTILFCKV